MNLKTRINAINMPIKQFLIIAIICSLSWVQGQNVSGKNLLIYTKNGKGYVHDNIAVSVATLKTISKKLNVNTTVSDNPEIFTSNKMSTFDAVIFSNTNNEAFDTDEQRQAFKTFCEQGKGFGAIHSAAGSERQWPWFWNLLGASFLRHPPFQEFKVNVVNTNHAATRDIGVSFFTTDECYFFKQQNTEVKVLLEADLSTVAEGENNTEPRPIKAPLSWYNTLYGGHQWYTALGHSKGNYEVPLFQKHLEGGLRFILSN